MQPEIIEAIQELIDFANNHAYDTFEPEENPEFAESYEGIIKATAVLKAYLISK